MAKSVVIDEIHVTVRIPASLPEAEAEVVRRTLAGRAFMARLRAAVAAALQAHPELRRCRHTLTR